MPPDPAIAESYAVVLDDPGDTVSAGVDRARDALTDADLLQRFALITHGRAGVGRDHPAAVVLVLCAAAVLGGMRSITAIAGWIADVPVTLLDMLYQRGRAELHAAVQQAAGGTDRSIASFPSKTTVWRVLTGADPDAVNTAVGAWLFTHAAGGAHADQAVADGGPIGVAVDGKAVRGAVDPDGEQTHLLAAATHGEQLVLGQVAVGVKVQRNPQFAPPITGLAAAGADPSTMIITADALHCQRGHATYLHGLGAQFCFPVKRNQPGVYDALDALPWTDTPIGHRHIDRGHGRVVTRTIQVLPAPEDLPFPHVNARVRTGNGPHVMAALRNLAIGAVHLLGRREITETTRWITRRMHRTFDLLHLNHT